MSAPAPGTQSKPELQPRAARWLPVALAAIAACLVAACAYYGLKFLRGSTFSDERAFRALGEIVGQFDNLQDTMTSLLQLVPPRAADGNVDDKNQYLASLALEDLRLDPNCKGTGKCSQQVTRERATFQVDMNGAARTFHVQQCFPGSNTTAATALETCLQLSGDLLQHLPTFIAQQFFDTVIIAAPDGAAVAQVYGRSREESRVKLHDARADGLIITNASGLLRHAVEAEKTVDASAGKKDDIDLPPHPIVFDHAVAGEDYRVFVQPFEPRYALRTDTGASHSKLILIGLRHQNVLQSLSAALGPSGALAITTLTLLTIIGWPLLSLKFSSAQDPVSPAQVIAIVIAMLLIPAVLTVMGFSGWSRHRLTLWADAAAETYGRQVERALLSELSEDARILDGLAGKFATDSALSAAEFEQQCNEAGQCDKRIALDRLQSERKTWSPLHAVAPLNSNGRSVDLSINLYGEKSVQRTLDLHDREYFKSIKAGEEWRPASIWDHESFHDLGLYLPPDGFVAQRLFNRTDAARVLQVAVPMHYGTQQLGIVTGDSRAYPLTASIRPPLLRFAVIDSANGTVLFHSNDKRSLAENLLVETQQNASLRNVMHNRASKFNLDSIAPADHFDGAYMGEGHRFYHHPVAGLPWGIVVFYSENQIGVAVLQTAIATLATYFTAAAILILLVVALIAVVSGRPDLDLLARIWPQWRYRENYRLVAAWLTTALCMCAVFALGRLNEASDILILLAIVLVAVSGYLVRRRHSSREARGMSLRCYQNTFVRCMVCLMCALAVVPAAWFAIDYHDASVRALIRDELKQAGDDVEQRFRTMALDLRHAESGKQQATARPDARMLSEAEQVPGFKTGCRLAEDESDSSQGSVWEVTAFPSDPWLTRTGPPTLDPVRRIIWTLSTDRHLQRTWSGADQSSYARRNRNTERAKADATVKDPCAEAAKAHVVAAWLRSDDGHRSKMTLPLKGTTFVAAMNDRDSNDRRLPWTSGVALAATVIATLIALTLLAWHAARRLFGIRIPFTGRFSPGSKQDLNLQPLIDAEFSLLAVKEEFLAKNPTATFTSKDERDWRAVCCERIYRSMWESLSPDEQLLMHQLAKGKFANPENQAVIEALVRRGFLKLLPWPRIVETGFADYARTAESEKEFAVRQSEASRNLWSGIRVPLFAIVVLVTASMMIFAGSTMQVVSTTLAGVATLFGVIAQVTNFIRKDSKSMAQ